MQIAETDTENSRWPHRAAVVLACATFPLVWVGGLVTTTGSGMAVPDWPNTYGYNLFLYPWQEWITGPWALFLEHSHRLIGATVGILAIGLLAALLTFESRRWVKRLGFVVLALVIFQAALGGMRVLWDERTLAMVHGFTGPLFALTVAMVVFTSKAWREVQPARANVEFAGHIRGLAIVTAVLAYLQIVLGAVLRHVPVDADPATYVHAVRFHLFLAGVLTIHIVLLAGFVLFRLRGVQPLVGLACALIALVGIQLALGAGTWIVKFAVPSWAAGWISPQQFAVEQGGWVQTHIITAHVAAGSLILATAVALALYLQRILACDPSAWPIVRRELGAAV